eukprot:gnl/TRDRNA2_/TRDRNA2_35551_c0_seq1.p1 gnl/TRDRNA2_/TRDRNA2_35551_c0~~gnl/TRDRNA2_/TRDRNA2_35551_c0_seq1.p1  ORF type:complete len:574 (+),score=92.56 gnl/TRDRNA2_/TRDRNA2_35551_c0_seq1:53-1774(+)
MRFQAFAIAALFVCAGAILHERGQQSFLRSTNAETNEEVILSSPMDPYPVPTAIRCIMNVCIQYMIVMLCLALVRTYHEVRGTPKGLLENALAAGAQTLALGPMLCVLCLACRMHVVYTSKGTDDPQVWAQWCMYVCTFALLFSTIVAFCIPLIIGKVPKMNKDTGDMEHDQEELEEHKATLISIIVLRYVILTAMYGGLVGVMLGIFLYVPPSGTWTNDEVPPPAPAPMCTVCMSVGFFTIFLIVFLIQTYSRITGHLTHKLESVMTGAARTMELGPMLCILFLAARMRALQMDPTGPGPQRWAQACFYVCTFALLTQTLLAFIVPLVTGGEIEHDKSGQTHYHVEHRALGYALVGLRWVIMLCIYGGVVAVIVSIFVIQHPKGPEHTIPVSPAVQCVINLTVQYFLVYLLLWIFLSMQEVSGYDFKETKFYTGMEAARTTVAFCPMLAILFVAARMRALAMTDNKGSPQAWAQDGMFMSTWATLISLCMCLITGLFMKVEVDEEGNVVNKFESWALAIPFISIRYLTMLLMYCGIVVVIISIFVITPETANGRGSTYVPKPASAPPNTAGL